MTDRLFTGKIEKLDEDQRMVFGWAYVAVTKTGDQVTDHSGDEVDPANLEDVAYDYVLHSREGGEMHVEKGVSTLVESVVITKEKLEAWGLAEDALPLGWWVGFHVTDDAVWKRVKDGELGMFSIGGTGTREEITA
jgi:hypothetical protein